VSNYKDDTPKSGVPGISWHAANGNWIVRHKVKGVEQFLGSFDDLEDAKRVKAQAMVLREPKPRRHDDSTDGYSDAFLSETFALDDDDDAMWRKRPFTSDMNLKQQRENARWNSRHAGKKLDERPKLTGTRHMWARDIVARLVAIRERPESADEAVTPRWKQTLGMPQRGDYEAILATVRALPSEEREVHASRLEGLIIPAALFGEGPLARMLTKVKREIGLNQRELYVLSGMKDPFAQDTPTGHQLGRWLKVRLDLYAPGRTIHLRGVHYLLVATKARKPDGTPYTNTKADYTWLNDRVAKAARWLRYVPFDRIVDERNEEAIIARAPRGATAFPSVYVSTGYNGLDLPKPVSVSRAMPHAVLAGLRADQRFCFAVFGEKSSLAEVLKPFAERHGADLFIATGELSERRAYEMARDAVRDGRTLVCLTFCDFDPSGHQMPVSIGVKLMAQKTLQFPGFDFIVQPVALSLDDVVRLKLPTAMVEKEDKRKDAWQEAHAEALIEAGLLTQEEVDGGGLAQVEIDALTAIMPEELNRIAEAAIAPYLDNDLEARTNEVRQAWEDEAETALTVGIDRSSLDLLSHAERLAANRFNALLRSLGRTKDRLDAIEARMLTHAEGVALPPIPEAPKADGERSEAAKPMIDSVWGYLRMVKAMKDRKAYDETP
jgi:hypothetical protein